MKFEEIRDELRRDLSITDEQARQWIEAQRAWPLLPPEWHKALVDEAHRLALED